MFFDSSAADYLASSDEEEEEDDDDEIFEDVQLTDVIEKGMQSARVVVCWFLVSKGYEELEDGLFIDFEKLIIRFYLWCLFDKEYTLSPNSIHKNLLFSIAEFRNHFPEAARMAGYDKNLSLVGALKRFKRYSGYKLLRRSVRSIFGSPKKHLGGPKTPLFLADIRDYLLKSVGIGPYGLRLRAFLYAVMDANFGPRAGSWSELTEDNISIDPETGRRILHLLPNKLGGKPTKRRDVYLSKEADEAFSEYWDSREMSVLDKELTVDVMRLSNGVRILETKKVVFYKSTASLSESIADCGARAGFGVRYFTGHSSRVGDFIDHILEQMMDNRMSFKDAAQSGQQAIGWVSAKTSESYMHHDVFEQLGRFLEQNKTSKELTVQDRHPDLAKEPQLYRVQRICNNDGFPVALKSTVSEMKAKLNITLKGTPACKI